MGEYLLNQHLCAVRDLVQPPVTLLYGYASCHGI